MGVATELSVKQATEIIVEAQNIGVYGGYLPDNDAERLQEAKRIIEDARTAWEQKARGDKVRAILSLVPEESPRKEEDADPIPTPTTTSADSITEPVRGLKEVFEQHQIEIATKRRERAFAKIREKGLPLPPEFEGEPPILPRDITVLSDLELRQYQSNLMAAQAQCNWEVAIALGDEDAALKVSEHYFAKRIKTLDKIDVDTRKPKTIPVLEAEASEDPKVVEWRDRLIDNRNTVRLLKSLRDGYLKSIDVISREFTMREAERDNTT